MEETVWKTVLNDYGAIILEFRYVHATKSIQKPAYFVKFDLLCKIGCGSGVFFWHLDIEGSNILY